MFAKTRDENLFICRLSNAVNNTFNEALIVGILALFKKVFV
jgi:hypothetical protein